MSPTPNRGMDVPSTRPTSRRARREQAGRVNPEQAAAEPAEQNEAPTTGEVAEREEKTVSAPAKRVTIARPQRPQKRSFATQLRRSTFARLEWLRAHGYRITDIADDAITAYLDANNVPPADDDGHITE
ncbi:hypothetical protein [Nocardia sp. NPDC004260]